MRLGALVIALAVMAGCAPGNAVRAERVRCDRHADPAGSDSAPGTATRPFRTPQRLTDALRPGETGCLGEGVYETTDDDGYVLRFERGGRARAPVTVRSGPEGGAHLVGIVLFAPGADHVQLGDVSVEGTGDSNTIKVYAADTVIEDSQITNSRRGESCVILGSPAGGRAVRPTVRGNTFTDCGALANENHDHGIYAAEVDDAQIVDNVFVNPAATSIQLYPDAQGSYVARNVIDGGTDSIRGGIVIGGDSRTASGDNLIENNVIAYAKTHSVYSFWQEDVGEGNVVRANCTWAAGIEADIATDGVTVEDNVKADPGFADRDSGDYRLGDGECREVVGFPGHSSSRYG